MKAYKITICPIKSASSSCYFIVPFFRWSRQYWPFSSCIVIPTQACLFLRHRSSSTQLSWPRLPYSVLVSEYLSPARVPTPTPTRSPGLPQTEFCTANNLALAQPRDAYDNYAGCVAWFNSSHGGQVSLDLANRYCTAYKDNWASEFFYAVKVDACSGNAHAGASSCNYYPELTQSLFRRDPIAQGGGKKRNTDGNIMVENGRRSAEAHNELQKRAGGGGGGGKTTKPSATTTPPPTTAAPICSIPNSNWPAEYTKCDALFCNMEVPESCPMWTPHYCAYQEGDIEHWSGFQFITTQQFRSVQGAPSFAYYNIAWGPVSQTNPSQAAADLQTAANIIFKRMQCSQTSPYCSGCTGL